MGIQDVFPKTVFTIYGIPVKDTVLQAALIVLVLGILLIVTHRHYRVWNPPTWQIVVEYLVEYIEGLVRDMAGRALPEVVPLLTTMIVFVAMGNLLGLVPGLKAPTRDLSTTVALSTVALGAWLYFGVRARGLAGYLRSYLEPMAFMLPLNLLGLFSRLLSMTLRLFGNVIAGEVISAVMFGLVPVLAPLPLALLGMITSVLQALVFTVLTFVFIVDAMGLEVQPEGGAASTQ